MIGRGYVKKKIKIELNLKCESSSSESDDDVQFKTKQAQPEPDIVNYEAEHVKKKIKNNPDLAAKSSYSDSKENVQSKEKQAQPEPDIVSYEAEHVKKKIKIHPDLKAKSLSSDSDDDVQFKRKQAQPEHNIVNYMVKQVQKKIKIDPDLEAESLSSDSDDDVESKCKQLRPEPDRVSYEAADDDVDEIGEILERKRAAEQLPPEKVQCLRGLEIKLRHKVLPQHKIERACGSHIPTAEEKKAFKELIHPEPIKSGVFEPYEDQIIADNWKAFCKMHNWNKSNPKPFIYLRHNTGYYLVKWNERKKFVQFLADGLPYRTLYSVYHRFRNLYDNPKVRSKYNSQEDEYIIKYIEQTKNVDETRMFAVLAKVLDRTRASVWRRYRLLKKKRREHELND